MAASNVEVQGVPEALALLERAGRALPDAVTDAVGRVQRQIFAESQREVPVLTGELAASGEMQSTREGESQVFSISYGARGAQKYASIVHWSQKLHHPHGKARFLTDPYFRGITAVEREAATAVDVRLMSL